MPKINKLGDHIEQCDVAVADVFVFPEPDYDILIGYTVVFKFDKSSCYDSPC